MSENKKRKVKKRSLVFSVTALPFSLQSNPIQSKGCSTFSDYLRITLFRFNQIWYTLMLTSIAVLWKFCKTTKALSLQITLIDLIDRFSTNLASVGVDPVVFDCKSGFYKWKIISSTTGVQTFPLSLMNWLPREPGCEAVTPTNDPPLRNPSFISSINYSFISQF